MIHSDLTGRMIPDLSFQNPDGSERRLSAVTNGPLVLIFLRHLA